MGIMDMLEGLEGPEYEETTIVPETETSAPEAVADEEENYPEEAVMIQNLRKGLRIRPEVIMGIVAVLAAAVLIGVIMLCQPYFGEVNEDPEALSQRHEALHATEPVQVTVPESETMETEPKIPTIPPESNPYDRNDFQYHPLRTVSCCSQGLYDFKPSYDLDLLLTLAFAHLGP